MPISNHQCGEWYFSFKKVIKDGAHDSMSVRVCECVSGRDVAQTIHIIVFLISGYYYH